MYKRVISYTLIRNVILYNFNSSKPNKDGFVCGTRDCDATLSSKVHEF